MRAGGQRLLDVRDRRFASLDVERRRLDDDEAPLFRGRTTRTERPFERSNGVGGMCRSGLQAAAAGDNAREPPNVELHCRRGSCAWRNGRTVARDDRYDPRVNVEIARQLTPPFVEQIDEPARDVAEPDEDELVLSRARRNGPGQQIANALEPCCQVVDTVAESDPQVAVHPEVIAGDDQHALLRAEPVDELGGVDRVPVTHVHDRARVGRSVVEETVRATRASAR